jgi:glycoside/pentoside/hexuronide:cation symporter, GPH family
MALVPGREQANAPRLSLGVKLSYGLGAAAEGIGGVALSTTLINFYLVVVVGLRPAVVGLVILVSLVIDALIDPLIGRASDTLRSAWGRRHPFMYASALPIALAIAFLWRRPEGLSAGALAAYVLAMLVIVRLAHGLYMIPSNALAPELAPGYHERTGLISYRYLFGFTGAGLIGFLAQAVFLRKDASHPLGQYDPAAYAGFGLTAAVLVFVAILVSSVATHRYIPQLRQAPAGRRTLASAARESGATLANRSLLVVMTAGLFSGVAAGMAASLAAFMHYYFWGLTPQVVAVIGALTAPAALVGIRLAPWASRRLDKKRTMMTVFFLSIFVGVIPPTLRLTGVLQVGSALIPPVLVADGFVAGALVIMGHILVGSMVADVADDAAVRTGVRSEGLLFAVSGLLPKITTGVGTLVGNLMLESVHVPVGVGARTAALVTPDVMQRLVLMALPAGIALHIIAVSLLAFYRIDRGAHEANLEALRLSAPLGATPTELATEVGLPDPSA